MGHVSYIMAQGAFKKHLHPGGYDTTGNDLERYDNDPENSIASDDGN